MLPSIDALNRAGETWRTYAWAATWQACVVATIALLLVRVGRRWPAPLRAAILLVALLKFLTPPMMTMPMGLFRFAPPASETQTVRLDERGTGVSPVQPINMGGTPMPRQISEPSSLNHPAETVRLSRDAFLMLAHAAGGIAIGGWIAIGMLRLRWMSLRAERVTAGTLHQRMIELSKQLRVGRVELLLSDEAMPPMAFGIVRRRVMLPRAIVERLSRAELETILAHELAHHRRRDTIVTILQLIVLAAWWFNPLAWLIGRALRRVREECCDDVVIAEAVADGQGYCRTMLACAEQLASPLPMGATFAVAEPLHPLGGRMKRIMDPALRRVPRLPRRWLAAVMIVAAVVLPGVRSRAQDAKTPGAEAATKRAATKPVQV